MTLRTALLALGVALLLAVRRGPVRLRRWIIDLHGLPGWNSRERYGLEHFHCVH